MSARKANVRARTHRHRAIEDHWELRCYTGGARDQRAAGGVTDRDHCRCGATRDTHRNGFHQERGRWLLTEPPCALTRKETQ